MTAATSSETAAIPDRAQILAFLDSGGGTATKRDIAQAFGIRGGDRIALKALLHSMEEDGVIARSRRSFRRASRLPSVTIIEIPGDADPDHMIGYPVRWNNEDGNPPGILVATGSKTRVVPAPGDRVLVRLSECDDSTADIAWVAKPMKIVGQPKQKLIGIVRRKQGAARLIPVDRKNRELQIRVGDLNGAEDGDLVEVEKIISGRRMIPHARVSDIVGNPTSEKAVSLIALHSMEIPYRFPESVLAEAEASTPAKLNGRQDWRELPFVTIDPATAKDHDDAVYAHRDTDRNNEGGFVVYVAIADVAHYVLPGSEMDREAQMRGNSVYFPDRVVPMLPEKIANQLCSLVEDRSRAALGLRMVFDASGKRRAHSFHRTLIRSIAKLTYEQAQAAIDGDPDCQTESLLDPVLKPLFAAFGAMEIARNKREPLALDMPERRILLNSEGMVDDVQIPERLTAHRLIEEIMIQSNVCAAETLERHKMPFLYRVHEPPSPQKLATLQEPLKSFGINFNPGGPVKPGQFNRILAKAAAGGNPALVSELVLRAQSQAAYSPDNVGHYGLGLHRYSHFTSPIRRYADLIVHRALVTVLDAGAGGLRVDDDARELHTIAAHISMTERRAAAAERETGDRLLARFLADQIGARFAGRIAGVVGSGLFVRLDRSGATGFIPVRTLGSEYFVCDATRHTLTGERSGETFAIGDAVVIRVAEAQPISGSLKFELLSDGDRKRSPYRNRTGKAARHRSAKRTPTGSKKRQQSALGT